MHLTQMDSFLIRVMYLVATGMVVLTVLGAPGAASFLFTLTFFLAVLFWFAGAIRRVTWMDAILIFLVGLSLSNVIINAWAEETRVSLGYMKKYAMFICTLVFFQASIKLSIDEKTEKFLLNLNSLLAVFLIVYFYANPITVYLMNNRVSNYLTFGFTNPNLTALFLLCFYTGELIRIARSRGIFRRLWHVFLAAYMLYFVWETESRNCLLTITAVTFLCFLLYLTKHGYRFTKGMALLISLWPLIFFVLYMALVENAFVQQVFAFMAKEGKGLDARIMIWRLALMYFGKSPILGAYSQISRGTGMSQLHNTHLDILTSYGVVVLILVCYMLFHMLSSKDSKNLKEETMLRICFAGTIIMGMGEAALFSGGMGLYIFSGMFLLLCNKRQGGKYSVGQTERKLA